MAPKSYQDNTVAAVDITAGPDEDLEGAPATVTPATTPAVAKPAPAGRTSSRKRPKVTTPQRRRPPTASK